MKPIKTWTAKRAGIRSGPVVILGALAWGRIATHGVRVVDSPSRMPIELAAGDNLCDQPILSFWQSTESGDAVISSL